MLTTRIETAAAAMAHKAPRRFLACKGLGEFRASPEKTARKVRRGLPEKGGLKASRAHPVRIAKKTKGAAAKSGAAFILLQTKWSVPTTPRQTRCFWTKFLRLA